jgi:uncharacterized membrane protein YhaH (DUF805 family)
MMTNVLTLRWKDNEIEWIIILLIVILVMHNLTITKWTSEDFTLSDHTMLVSLAFLHVCLSAGTSSVRMRATCHSSMDSVYCTFHIV